MHPICCYYSSKNINCHSIQAARKKSPNNIERSLDFYYYSQFYMATFQTAAHGVHPSGIFIPGTELLQSPFRTEFIMGSRSRRYRRFLRRHRQFVRSCRRFLRSCRRSLWRLCDRRPRGRRCCAAFVARLAKHHKTLLNIVKHHETHVKHCETL